jgi:hypothetical protein
LDIKFSTKPYLPTLVISVILFIMVFLPWATVSALGMAFSANGTQYGGGVLTLIMSIIGAGISFLANQKYRTFGTIGVGILALIGVAIAWAGLGGAGVGFGLIIALIVALGLLAVGYMDYRKLNPPAKPAQPPPANPPAPPPAPPKR